MLTRFCKAARMSERPRDREKNEMNKVSREICFGFFFLILNVTITTTIITSYARAFLCFQWEKLCVTNMNFPFVVFFFNVTLCPVLSASKWWHTLCKVSFKNHTTSNPSWMSGQHNVHRSQFLSFFHSLRQMYVKLTIALLNLSRHHQPLVVIRLK